MHARAEPFDLTQTSTSLKPIAPKPPPPVTGEQKRDFGAADSGGGDEGEVFTVRLAAHVFAAHLSLNTGTTQ